MAGYKGIIECKKCGKKEIARTTCKIFCKECSKINYNQWKRKWRENPVNRKRERLCNEKWRKKHPDVKVEIQKRYSKRNPEKVRAHRLANYYLKHLKKKGYVFHHTDYSKPLEVEVIPVKEHIKIHGGK